MSAENAWEQLLMLADLNYPKFFQQGIHAVNTSSPVKRSFMASGGTLTFALENDAITTQVTNENKAGFPKPIVPVRHEIEQGINGVTVISPDGSRRTAEQLFYDEITALLTF